MGAVYSEILQRHRSRGLGAAAPARVAVGKGKLLSLVLRLARPCSMNDGRERAKPL